MARILGGLFPVTSYLWGGRRQDGAFTTEPPRCLRRSVSILASPPKNKMLKKVLSKIFCCNEEDVDSVLLHIPCGLLNIAILVGFHIIHMDIIGAVAGLLWGYGFITYQKKEQHIIHDKAYADIQGWLWGLALASFISILILMEVHNG